PASDVPGEKASPTQPFPTRPPAYARNYLKVPDDLIDFTPEMRAQALRQIHRYKVGPWMYNPPVLGNVNGILGAITVANAGGAAAAGGLTVDGMSILKPPYGTISAVNLDRGEILWQIAHGDTPDNVRNHPALKGMTIPRTGQAGTGGIGLMVTRTLVVMGDPQITTTPEHPRGAMLRGYEKTAGKEVGAVWIAAPQSDAPMTYLADGKQYIVVAISGGNYSGEYVAFTLPNR